MDRLALPVCTACRVRRRLRPRQALGSGEGQRDLKIDWIGFGLVIFAIPLISIGFNSINRWGLLLAEPTAPFGVLGLSPAPVMIVAGMLATSVADARRVARDELANVERAHQLVYTPRICP